MAEKEANRSRPDLSVLRMDPEELEVRRGAGWVGWLLALILIAAGAWALYTFVELPFLQPQVEVASVRQVTPTQKSTVLTATGYTYARERAAVGAQVIGRILELPVEEGDTLKSGDLIAVLDSDPLEAAVRQAKASDLEARTRLVDAEREANRQQRLVDAEVGIRADLDAANTQRDVAEAQVELAKARLASAEAQLAYTRIYAPIDGVVIEKNVEVGEMVAPGGFTSQQSTGAILRMADPTSLEIEADINESYIARLERGQPATISVDAVPDFSYRGRLRQIVPTADRQRAVVQVKVSIDNRDDRLVPDMSCTVTFLDDETSAEELDAEPILYVPQAALLDGAAGESGEVFVLRDGVVSRRAVQLGDAEGTDRIVLDGLTAGEKVVVAGFEKLEDGHKVRVLEP
ncbi:MAG: efflux RND transporter periplasmic adaptor subunit [Acidobacteriota bacterium]